MTSPPGAEQADWTEEVLNFWFGLADERWWKADQGLDTEIRDRFEELYEEQRQFPAGTFLADPRTALAAVVLFDQFPRNMYRGHADQFATDLLALAIARGAVAREFDQRLAPRERGILYMPFQHSEDIDDQRQSMLLFTELGDDLQLTYARKHYDVIARFGRFPHRNAMLGRQPRPDEIAAGNVTPF